MKKETILKRLSGDLGLKQIAERLQISMRTARYLCQHGKIPGAYKMGRDWRVSPKSLELPEVVNRQRWKNRKEHNNAE